MLMRHRVRSRIYPGSWSIHGAPLILSHPSQIDRLVQADRPGLWVLGEQAAHALSYPDQASGECNAIEDISYWFQHRNASIAALLKSKVSDGLVLDVGGGNGSTTRHMLDAGLDCWLIEPSAEGCWNACQRGVPTVIMGTLEEIALPSHSVAAVGLFDVIEHIDDVGSLLREVKRVLRPGGHVAITVPALPWLWSSEDVYAGHFRRYTKHRLKRSLSDLGFTVDLSEYFFGPLVLPLFAGRVIPSKMGLRKGGDWTKAAKEHGADEGWMSSIVRRLLNREQRRMEAGRWPMLGTSCFGLARCGKGEVDA
ncbi:MAG: methyltransferase domain-containing protein [Phycisphaerales bacterium]|nr:methyltransferase domain-containing protein [Phycisphaerales bacterium]